MMVEPSTVTGIFKVHLDVEVFYNGGIVKQWVILHREVYESKSLFHGYNYRDYCHRPIELLCRIMKSIYYLHFVLSFGLCHIILYESIEHGACKYLMNYHSLIVRVERNCLYKHEERNCSTSKALDCYAQGPRFESRL